MINYIVSHPLVKSICVIVSIIPLLIFASVLNRLIGTNVKCYLSINIFEGEKVFCFSNKWYLQCYSQRHRLLSNQPFPKKPPPHSQPIGHFSVEQWNSGIVPVKLWDGQKL